MVRPSDAELEQLIGSVRALARGRVSEGDEGAAGMLLAGGAILTSTAPAAFNPSVEVRHETGAYCEAYKRDEKVVASVCLRREPDDRFLVLSPCGVYLERLAVHGPGVLVGVPAVDDSSRVSWVEPRDAHPYYWRKVFDDPSGF